MQLDISRHVDAHPDAVWDVLTDVHNAHRILRGVFSVEILTPGPYQPGFRWRETRRMFGIKSTEEMMVVEAEPPGATRIVAENGGTEYTTIFTVTPDETGSTLRMRFGAETAHAPAMSRVATAVMGPIAERSTRKSMEQDLADIAAGAEHRTP